MTNNSENSAQAHAQLREYCLRVIRFLASTALDPHRYFEQKYCGDVGVAVSRPALNEILITLADWCQEAEIPASVLDAFDQALRHDGFPSLSLICRATTREAGLVLACDRLETPHDARIASEFIRTANPDSADRMLAERRLSDYEQQ